MVELLKKFLEELLYEFVGIVLNTRGTMQEFYARTSEATLVVISEETHAGIFGTSAQRKGRIFPEELLKVLPKEHLKEFLEEHL